MVLQFAALLDRPETSTSLMAVVAESTRDEALRDRIRASIVDRQKRLVAAGARAGAGRAANCPPRQDEVVAARTADLIFDVIAGAVVHRALVSAEPVDTGVGLRPAATLLRGGPDRGLPG